MKTLIYRSPSDRFGKFLKWLNALRNFSGTYVIRDARTKRILYVGESHTGNLAKTIKRHFWHWRDDAERKHHTYDRASVEVATRLTPPTTAAAAQNNLILRLEPRDNALIPAERPF